GYVVREKIYGDLNKDGEEDCILLIKGTDAANWVVNRFDEKVDRNRRGLVVLFKKKNAYQLAAENRDCFLSENEDGGVYFPPELSLETKNGNLLIHYGHGRYGTWQYLFRYQEDQFKLIGYDSSSNYGPIINTQTSINFLTQRKLIRENTNEEAQGNGDEVFKETWSDLPQQTLISLSKIKNFEALDLSQF
ncbi:MAG: hypothetical protein AAFP02_23205, partial [Bacteroidota bacterium]